MSSSNNITGLILAGGAGSRVGGQDKGLLQWHGKALITHVAERLGPQVEHLLVSCNRNMARYAELVGSIIGDNRPDFQGPLAGIEAAATHITTEFLVVVACDMPEIPTDLVARLLEPLTTAESHGPQLSFANDGVRNHYLCVAMHCSCLASLPEYLDQGGRAVRHWYQLLPHVAIDFSDQPQRFANYNHLDLFSPE